MVFTFLENALNLCIFTHAPVPHSKLHVEFFQNVSPKPERVEKAIICSIKIQSENVKITLNISLFCMIGLFCTFCMICSNFSKCKGFTVLEIISIK